MSRRKQQKPRALKRDESEEEDVDMTDRELTEEEQICQQKHTNTGSDSDIEAGSSSLRKDLPDYLMMVKVDDSGLNESAAGHDLYTGDTDPSDLSDPRGTNESLQESEVNREGEGEREGSQTRYSCKFCRRTFRHRRGRDNHLKLHSPSGALSALACPTCGGLFSSANKLEGHLSNNASCTSQGQTHRYTCTECAQCFSIPLTLHSHLLSHLNSEAAESFQDQTSAAIRCRLDETKEILNSKEEQAGKSNSEITGTSAGDLAMSNDNEGENDCLDSSTDEYLRLKASNIKLECTDDDERLARFEAETKLYMADQELHESAIFEKHSEEKTVHSKRPSDASNNEDIDSATAKNSAETVNSPTGSNRGSISDDVEKISNTEDTPDAKASRKDRENGLYSTIQEKEKEAAGREERSVSLSMVSVKQEVEKIRVCPVCGCEFCSLADLCGHIESHTTGSRDEMNKEMNSEKREKSCGPKESENIGKTENTTRQQNNMTPNKSSSKSHVTSDRSYNNKSHSVTLTQSHKVSDTDEKLNCPFCSRSDFSRSSALAAHIQTKHSGTPNNLFSCLICGLGFSSRTKLDQHKSESHRAGRSLNKDLNVVESLKCDFCSLTFTSIESLNVHCELVHQKSEDSTSPAGSGTPSVVYCSQCTMGFPHIYALADHMHHYHGYSNRRHQTTPGGSGALGPGVLSPGVLSTSRSPLYATSPERIGSDGGADKLYLSCSSTVIVNESVIGNQQELNHCRQCDVILADRHAYQLHLEGHRTSVTSSGSSFDLNAGHTDDYSLSYPPLDEQTEAQLFARYLTLSTEYSCSTCNKCFTKPDELQKHLFDIHSHHLYRCTLCKQIFDSKVNIQVHFAVKHSSELRVFKCSVCSSVFQSEVEWQLHVKINHLGITRPFRCFFCRSSFSTEAELSGHMSSHAGQYSCPECNETFLVEYLLDKHLETHHLNPPPLTPSQHGSTATTSAPTAKSEYKNSVSRHLSGTNLDFDLSTLSHTSGAMNNCKISPYDKISPFNTSGSTGRSSSEELSQRQRDSQNTAGYYSSQGKESDATKALKNLENNLFTCSICLASYTSESSLQRHLTMEHGLSIEIQQLLVQTSPSMAAAVVAAAAAASASTLALSGDKDLSLTNSDMKFVQHCVYCKITFKTKHDFEKHMKSHVLPSNQKCNICDEIFSSALVLAEHKLSHCKVAKGNVCVVCKTSVKSKDQFFIHSQQHAVQGSPSMHCIICRQTLGSMLELQLHGNHHFQDAHICSVCSKECSENDLVQQVNGVETVVCSDCSKRESLASLRPSEPSGVDPLENHCMICSCTFENYMQLLVHIGMEHGSSIEKFQSEMLQGQKRQQAPQERTYQCIKCQESFLSESEIKLHVATHVLQEGNIHKCRICGDTSFESPARLQAHLIQHSYDDDWATDVGSGEPFRVGGAEKRGPGGEMKCYICDKAFLQASDIQAHMLQHGLSSRKYLCNSCPQRFFFSAELHNHRLTLNHDSLGSARPDPMSQKRAISQRSGDSSIKTSAVNLTMNGSSIKKNGSSSEYKVCKTPSSSSSTAVKDVKCPECHKKFANHANMLSHRRVHENNFMTSDSPIECTLCSAQCSSVREMHEHLLANHSTNNLQSYFSAGMEEDWIETDLSRASSRGVEGTMFGEEQKMLQCPECNRQFPSMSSLQGHMRVHNSGTKYSCNICGKSFSLPQNLTLHMKSHSQESMSHTNTKSVLSSLKIESHQSPHAQQYKCKVCYKKFPKKEALKAHIKTHGERRDWFKKGDSNSLTDTKAYSAALSNDYQALTHPRVNSEKQLCPICGGRFDRTADLALHLNKIHNVKTEVVEADYPPTQDNRNSFNDDQFLNQSTDVSRQQTVTMETVRAGKAEQSIEQQENCNRRIEQKLVEKIYYEKHSNKEQEEERLHLNIKTDSASLNGLNAAHGPELLENIQYNNQAINKVSDSNRECDVALKQKINRKRAYHGDKQKDKNKRSSEFEVLNKVKRYETGNRNEDDVVSDEDEYSTDTQATSLVVNSHSNDSSIVAV